MSEFPDSASSAPSRAQDPRTRGTALRHRLAELRGPAAQPQHLDARRLAALAANPGCRRRALLDGAGVDKAALAQALGAPSGFGQSQFAFVRGHAFEARVKADGGAELLRLVHQRLDPHAPAPTPDQVHVPDLTASGPEGRAARTALALREAAGTPSPATSRPPDDETPPTPSATGDTASAQGPARDATRDAAPDQDTARAPAQVADHTARGLERVPDAALDQVPHPATRATRGQGPHAAPMQGPHAAPEQEQTPGAAQAAGAARGRDRAVGRWTLLDHPMLSLDVAGTPAFLEPDAVVVHPDGRWTVVEIKSFPMIDGSAAPAKVGAAARQAAVYVLALERLAEHMDPAPRVGHRILLVCPRNFSNQPTGAAVDVRKQLSVTRRQLTRLTRIEEIADALPDGACFDLRQPAQDLHAAVEAVPPAYAPECLSACELAFHCRARARDDGAVTALGRGVRAELGGLTTVDTVLAAAHGEAGDPSDPTVAALRRATALRTEALDGGLPC